MRGAIAVLLVLLFAGAAGADDLDCAEWGRKSSDEKSEKIEAMIEGHVYSDKGRKYTSQNKTAMKRCLEGFTPRIIDEFDDTCRAAKQAGKKALDDAFDRYFLSCLQ